MKKLLAVLALCLLAINPAYADYISGAGTGGGGGGGGVESVSSANAGITVGGTTTNRTVGLTGISGTPGNNKYYGTDGSGTLGLHDAASGTIQSGTNGQYAIYDGNGTIIKGTSVSPGGGSSSFVNNFRLTLSSGVPNTTSDVTAATTIYEAPSGGNQISLYDGSSSWTNVSSGQVSIAVPASAYRLYNIYGYNNSGALALELDAWDSGGQVTGTITAATSAGPCVITATNTLSDGDVVFIDGIVGTLGTEAGRGLNGKAWKVSSTSGTGFTLDGSDTDSLTYTSGGTFYKVPSAPTTAVTMQDGIRVKTGATTRRYLGVVMTRSSGQTEDSKTRVLLANADNALPRVIMSRDGTADDWNYAGPGVFRPSHNNTDPGVGRNEIVTAQGSNYADITVKGWAQTSTGQGRIATITGLGINSCLANSADSSGGAAYDFQESPGFDSGGFYKNYAPVGYSFLQRIEYTNNFPGSAATFVGTNNAYGDASNIFNGIYGTVMH